MEKEQEMMMGGVLQTREKYEKELNREQWQKVLSSLTLFSMTIWKAVLCRG